MNSRQQAALSIARQIDKARQWAAQHNPALAAQFNDAIATELMKQAQGYAPTPDMKTLARKGFGDAATDFLSNAINSVPTDTGAAASFVSDTASGGSSLVSDLSGAASLFSAAGSSATPSFADTAASSGFSPSSIVGVLNSLSNVADATVKSVFEPQIQIAQAQTALNIAKSQATAANLAVPAALASAQSMQQFMLLGGIGLIAVFALQAISGHKK